MFSNQLVSETDVEDALKWLATNDDAMARAHAEVDKFEALQKVTIAELMSCSDQKTAKDREADALSSQEYRLFLEEKAEVVRKDRQLKLKASYMNTLIDVYRTISANQRKVTV